MSRRRPPALVRGGERCWRSFSTSTSLVVWTEAPAHISRASADYGLTIPEHQADKRIVVKQPIGVVAGSKYGIEESLEIKYLCIGGVIGQRRVGGDYQDSERAVLI